MNQFRTEAIILRRTNYGEADRIINFLTPEHGKVSAIAKGVRRSKSKLAGGLELFATSDIGIARRPASEFGTVTSARLIKFYGDILHDYDRVVLGYELIKQINRATETVSDTEFYYLLRDSFEYLNVPSIDKRVIELWFRLRLARALGAALNLAETAERQRLNAESSYNFDFSDMAFVPHPNGKFTADHIKFLRLANAKNPAILRQVSGVEAVINECLWLVRAFE